jgi:hypothetical protein
MMFKKKYKETNIFKSVLMAYFILILHVFLIAVLGLLVIFFAGIVNYMVWIFLGTSAVILSSGCYFYKRMKEQGKTFSEMVNSPLFSGRAIEISLFGGFASLKLGKPYDIPRIGNSCDQVGRLENRSDIFINELCDLAQLLENNLITLEEYNIAKQRFFQ